MAAVRTDRRLLADLLKRLRVTPQALSQRRQRLQKLVAMPVDIATYIIAHREGMRIDRYLDHDTIERVNRVEEQLRAKESAAVVPARTTPSTKPPSTASAAGRRARRSPLSAIDAVLSATQLDNAQRMAEQVYPVLYAFENSVREFLDGHLTAAYGHDWFSDNQIVSKGPRENVERNRKAEDRNRYHSQRTARPIYYTNLDDLSKIVQSTKGCRVFKDLFPRPTWFPELVGRFEVSRYIVAHMNPVTATDVRRLQDGLKEWTDQVKPDMPPSWP